MSTPAERAISISRAISGSTPRIATNCVLRQTVERATAGQPDVGGVLGEHHGTPAAREERRVLHQEQRRARLDMKRDVVLELEHPDAVLTGRHADGSSAGGGARVDRGLAGASGVLRAQAGGAEGFHVAHAVSCRLLVCARERVIGRTDARPGEGEAAPQEGAA